MLKQERDVKGKSDPADKRRGAKTVMFEKLERRARHLGVATNLDRFISVDAASDELLARLLERMCQSG